MGLQNKKNNFRRFFGFLPKLAKYVFCIYILVTLLTCCFVMPFWGHPLQRSYINFNIIFLLVALISCVLYLILSNLLSNKIHAKISSKKTYYKKFLIISTIVLFILQLLVVYGKLFIAGWDVGRIYFTTPVQDYYFSIYPNNLFLKGIVAASTNIISSIPGLTDLFIEKAFAAFSGNELLQNLNNQTAAECINYVIAVVINCILVNASVMLSSLICKKLMTTKVAITEYVFAAIFISLMPWILVPYSDTIALFFTTLILFSYININKPIMKYSIIIFATIAGFNIKPTVIFAVIAIIFIEVCKYICNFKKPKKIAIQINKFAKNSCIIILSFVLSLGLVFIIKTLPDVNIDKNKEYTSTHYLMMGANPFSLGFYWADDVSYSDSFATVAEREEGNLKIWENRIRDLGPSSLFQLITSKNMCNYSDGTFMWAMDSGPKFSMIDIGKNQIIKWIYDNYYYLAQILWFAVIIGIIANLFIRKNNKNINMIATTLLLLSVFLMIFECGARYLILYLPYFVIMSSFGWVSLSAIIRKKLIKNK